MSRKEVQVLQFLKKPPWRSSSSGEGALSLGQAPLNQFTNNTYHQRQLIGVSRRTRQGRQAGADLVVTVTTPNWQHRDVPELVGLVLPLLSHCRVEIYTEQRFHIYPNLYFISKLWYWKKHFSSPSRYGSRASTGARWGEAWVMMRLTRLVLKRGRV